MNSKYNGNHEEYVLAIDSSNSKQKHLLNFSERAINARVLFCVFDSHCFASIEHI